MSKLQCGFRTIGCFTFLLFLLAGGLLTLVMVIPHKLRKAAGQPEIPYGIAIAFAGMWLISERFLNQFV